MTDNSYHMYYRALARLLSCVLYRYATPCIPRRNILLFTLRHMPLCGMYAAMP